MAPPRDPGWDWNFPLLRSRTSVGCPAGPKPNRAHLWRPVSAWLSAESPPGAQWSQCGSYCQTPCAFCSAGGWGCVTRPGPPGRRGTLWGAPCPCPQEDHCLLGLQSGQVCFHQNTPLGEGRQPGKEGTKVTRSRQDPHAQGNLLPTDHPPLETRGLTRRKHKTLRKTSQRKDS